MIYTVASYLIYSHYNLYRVVFVFSFTLLDIAKLVSFRHFMSSTYR